MKELGSEFWIESEKYKKKYENIENSENQRLLMSGRTAIDYALKLIETKNKIKKVYFPSYCCESMLQPFVERNIKIEFYEVLFEDGNLVYKIDLNNDCDVFFAMNYFGFSKYNMDYYIEKFKKNQKIVIEDSTHSWLSKRKYNPKSDYVVVSLRKWFPIISGGLLISNTTFFENNKEHKTNEKYIYVKRKAMKLKKEYINNNINQDKKNEFLDLFSMSNSLLKEDYSNYDIDIESYNILKKININRIIRRRNSNTTIIYNMLNKQTEIEYLKDYNENIDCPIFVPVFLDFKKREEIRKNLIDNQVYCPIHWPVPNIIENDKQKEIYNEELSLICDQRYETDDIKEYIKLI